MLPDFHTVDDDGEAAAEELAEAEEAAAESVQLGLQQKFHDPKRSSRLRKRGGWGGRGVGVIGGIGNVVLDG